MSRVAFILGNPAERAEAVDVCRSAPSGTYVEFRDEASKRSDAQNRLMWPLLSEIARQVEWPAGSGMKLSSEDWKLIFLDALGYEMRMVPGIHMRGYVNLGRSSSALKVKEFSDLIEIIYAFGAEHSVKFKESKPEAEAASRSKERVG